MEAIIALLNTYLADNATLRWTAIAVVAVIIFVFASGVSVILMGVTDPIRRRLGMISTTRTTATLPTLTETATASHVRAFRALRSCR